MSSTSDSRKEHVSLQGSGDCALYYGSAMNSRRYTSDNASAYLERKTSQLDRQGQDEIYSQTYHASPQAHTRPSSTNTQDRTNQLLSLNRSHYSDCELRGASAEFGDTWRHGRDDFNGRSRLSKEIKSPCEDDSSHRGISFKASLRKIRAGLVESCDDESIASDERRIGSEACISDLQQQIHLLKTQNDVHIKTIAELHKGLKIEAETNQKIKESANKMAHAMESKDLILGLQESDDTIYSLYHIVFGQIKTWSVPFAQDRPPSHFELAADVIEDFQKVAPAVTDFPRFLQAPKNVRLFVRGYVSLAISHMLFRTLPTGTHPGSGGQDIWMDRKLAHGVVRIETSLFHADRKSISPRELNDWRALTTWLISKADDKSSGTTNGMRSCVAQYSSQIMGVVGNLVAPEKRGALEDTLSTVLLQATKLSQTLRSQRACWSVRHLGDVIHQRRQSRRPDELILFDEATMDDKHGDEDSDEEEGQSEKIVEMFITPCLFKSGNSDGERFDVETCFERSEVKCRTWSSSMSRERCD